MCIRDRENGAYQIYWIPFYQSSGFRAWKPFGFDYAIMQPNYASVSYTHLDVYKRQHRSRCVRRQNGGRHHDDDRFRLYAGHLPELLEQRAHLGCLLYTSRCV